MECWTQNNWRTPQNGKSKGCDKQTDDFQAGFPNFMTLTDEERHAFFQTLYAAKVKLENSGVTVKPFFGTVHDQSWNSDAFEHLQDDACVSLGSKISAPHQNNFPSGSLGPTPSKNSIGSESSAKVLKEDEIFGEVSQESPEGILKRNDSLECLGFNEKEVAVTSFNGILKNMKIPSSDPVISSLSCEILSKGDDDFNYEHRKEDELRMKGTKLKVQVTLTSGDNERIKSILFKPKQVQTAFTRGEVSPKENDKKKDEDVKSAKEIIDDPEIKDLLIVEKESVEELPEEEKKPLNLIRKKSSESKKKELKFETDLGKGEGKKVEFEEQLPLKKKTETEETLQERSKIKRLIGKEKPKKKQKDKEIVKSNSNASIKNDAETIQQSLLAMTTPKKETDSSRKPEKQEAGVAVKNGAKRRTEAQKRVEKLKKCLEKREMEYQKMMKRRNELKAQRKEKLAESKKDLNIKKKPTSPNLEREEAGTEVPVVVACTEETKEGKEDPEIEIVGGSDSAQIGDAAGTVTCSDPAQMDDAAGDNKSSREEKALKLTKNNLEVNEECATPLKPGKVVFVYDNAIEKIRNVILDLEKHAKGEDGVENEYLVLLLDYVEYLTTVMGTLCEQRVVTQTQESPSVRFDEENLKEIQEVLRVSYTTTDDELESNHQLEIRKKRKKNKSKKALLIKRLKKCFRCAKTIKNKRTESSSSNSSR